MSNFNFSTQRLNLSSTLCTSNEKHFWLTLEEIFFVALYCVYEMPQQKIYSFTNKKIHFYWTLKQCNRNYDIYISFLLSNKITEALLSA